MTSEVGWADPVLLAGRGLSFRSCRAFATTDPSNEAPVPNENVSSDDGMAAPVLSG